MTQMKKEKTILINTPQFKVWSMAERGISLRRNKIFISISLILLTSTGFTQKKMNMEIVRTFIGHTMPVLAIAYSPDGKYIASASRDKLIKIWEVSTGRTIHTLAGHSYFVLSVAFSPDGKYIASCSKDKTLKVWEAKSGKLLHTLEHADELSSVTYLPNGKYLAACSYDGSIIIIEILTFRTIYNLSAHSEWAISVV